jgi:antitoxin component of MazEF toxin-antitoxin module
MELKSSNLIKPMLTTGNKKVMVLPDEVLKAAGFKQGDVIYVYSSTGSIFIQKTEDK